jgi:hypothetical protein
MSDSPVPDTDPLRPRDFAVLLLSSGDLTPRKRARDQQADRAGLDLKRRVLEAVATLDPEPQDLEAALLSIVEDIGPPTGPTRAVARMVIEEWQAIGMAPAGLAHLLDEALRGPREKARRHGRQLPG